MSVAAPASFEDATGQVRLEGTLELPDGLPGGLIATDFLFTERATAGTYTATLALPAGATVLDVWVYILAVKTPGSVGWAANAATLSVGDTLTGATAYYNALDLVGVYFDVYTPTNVSDGDNYEHLQGNGNTYGSAPALSQGHGPGVTYFAADTLTMTVATTIASPPVTPAGRLRVRVWTLPAPAQSAAVFA